MFSKMFLKLENYRRARIWKQENKCRDYYRSIITKERFSWFLTLALKGWTNKGEPEKMENNRWGYTWNTMRRGFDNGTSNSLQQLLSHMRYNEKNV